jgi:magnesium transporter
MTAVKSAESPLALVEDAAPAPSGTAGQVPPAEAAPADAPPKGRHEAKAKHGLRLPRRFRKPKPGSVPGLEPQDLARMPSVPGTVRITCIDYCADQVAVQDVRDIDRFIRNHRPPWSAVRWINVDGLADMGVIKALAEKYRLHPLAVEDLLHVPQRPKLDWYEGGSEYQARVFIIARMIELKDNHLESEQISFFLGHKTVLTFQETPGDVWDPIRQRLQAAGSLLRQSDASFLVYSLIDAVVDHCFPILERYGDLIEDLEDQVLERPTRDAQHEIHRIKRDLLLLRHAVWPMREVVHRLQREPHECFSDHARTYMRDVYDHTVQIIDIIETYREVAVDLRETYLSSMSHRLNEIMKVLTIIGTIFIPLTFLAGVYGMNFHYFPELNWPWSYGVFWLVCLSSAVAMVFWFRHKHWL